MKAEREPWTVGANIGKHTTSDDLGHVVHFMAETRPTPPSCRSIKKLRPFVVAVPLSQPRILNNTRISRQYPSCRVVMVDKLRVARPHEMQDGVSIRVVEALPVLVTPGYAQHQLAYNVTDVHLKGGSERACLPLKRPFLRSAIYLRRGIC